MKTISLILAVTSFAFAEATFQGTLLNSSNVPLAGALLVRLSDSAKTVSDVSGKYTFLQPAVDVSTATSSSSGLNANTGSRVCFNGKSAQFTLTRPQSVAIEQYTASGQKIFSTLPKLYDAGTHSVPTSKTRSYAGAIITRLRIADKPYTWSSTKSSTRALALRSANDSDEIAIYRYGYRSSRIKIGVTQVSTETALEADSREIKVTGGSFTQGLTPTNSPFDWTAWSSGSTYSSSSYTRPTYEPAHSTTVNDFNIDKYNVTDDDYEAYTVANGMPRHEDTLTTMGNDVQSSWSRGAKPVIRVSWYDAVDYANWLSIQNGLTPVYIIDKSIKDINNILTDLKDSKRWTVTPNWSANGYRLLTEAEYEYASRGGQVAIALGHNYKYSGSDDFSEVAESILNASNVLAAPINAEGALSGPETVASKKANDLGIFGLSSWFSGSWLWDPALSTSKYFDYTPLAQNNPTGTDGTYDKRAARIAHCVKTPNAVYDRTFKSPAKACSWGIRLGRSAL